MAETPTTLLVAIHGVHSRQIQIVDHITDEVDQMVFRQPVPEAAKKQKLLIRKVRPGSCP